VKLSGHEFYTETGEPVLGLLVTLYKHADHSKHLAETYTDSTGRWYFHVKRAGTYDVCVQRLREGGGTETKWIVGLVVKAPRRYLLRQRRLRA
jgi:hypothetical protein